MDRETKELSWVAVEELLRNPPFPPRDESPSLDFLMSSVRLHGVISPLLARRLTDGTLQIVSGYRRALAARENELLEIPAMVGELEDAEAIRCYLSENICRQDLGDLAREEILEMLRGLREEGDATLPGELDPGGDAPRHTGTAASRGVVDVDSVSIDASVRMGLDVTVEAMCGLFADVRESKRIDMIRAEAILDRLLEIEEHPARVAEYLYESGPSDSWLARHSVLSALVLRTLAPDGFCGLGESGYALAGLVHDVGMVYLSHEIVEGPTGTLSREQRRELQSHPRIGHALISTAGKDYAEIALAARDHHERLDGSGYSGGLRGGQIGRLARACGIADSFCAMIGRRAFREPVDPSAAIERLERAAREGSYDPDLVAELSRALENRGVRARSFAPDPLITTR